VETATRAIAISTRARYVPRGRNQLHTIFDRHLDEFCDVYDEKYAAKYGMFRLERTLLFAEVSRLIYTIISEFYAAAAGKPLLSGVIAAHQTFGDQLRWNPHHHCLVLEGGFDASYRTVAAYVSRRRTEIYREGAAAGTPRRGSAGSGFLPRC
jgi:hypothetical protein